MILKIFGPKVPDENRDKLGGDKLQNKPTSNIGHQYALGQKDDLKLEGILKQANQVQEKSAAKPTTPLANASPLVKATASNLNNVAEKTNLDPSKQKPDLTKTVIPPKTPGNKLPVGGQQPAQAAKKPPPTPSTQEPMLDANGKPFNGVGKQTFTVEMVQTHQRSIGGGQYETVKRTYTRKVSYEGNFVNGLPDGKGKETSTITAKDGPWKGKEMGTSTYEGDYVQGKHHGKGTATRTERDVDQIEITTTYKGEFANGAPNGRGSQTVQDDYQVTFQKGNFKDGKINDPKGLEIRKTETEKTIYIGGLKDGKKDGEGRSISQQKETIRVRKPLLDKKGKPVLDDNGRRMFAPEKGEPKMKQVIVTLETVADYSEGAEQKGITKRSEPQPDGTVYTHYSDFTGEKIPKPQDFFPDNETHAELETLVNQADFYD